MTTVGIGKQYDMYASIVPVHAAGQLSGGVPCDGLEAQPRGPE